MEGRIQHLAAIIDPALPPYTRRAFTEPFLRGRRWLQAEFEGAGLSTVTDAGGNLMGKLAGSEPGALPIAMGSHSDTVVGGGRYDGIAGVVAALEVAQSLAEDGMRPRHPLWVVDFLAEEASDYGPSCVGSRAIAGTLSPAMLEAANAQGESLSEALRRMGGDPDRAAAGPIHGREPFAAFVEMHIEQGPVLESEGLPIGVVTGVVGIRRLALRVQGQADHAGTTPMHMRRDALVGAAELIKLVHQRAREAHTHTGLVATVGQMTHSPNQSNVVPESALLTIDARCASMQGVTDFTDAIVREGGSLLADHGLALEHTVVLDAEPCSFAPPVRQAIGNAARKRGHAFREMQSGAGHDAMHIAQVCPTGMLFVPSRGGRSHASQEHTTTQQLCVGAEVLLEAVLELDATLPLR